MATVPRVDDLQRRYMQLMTASEDNEEDMPQPVMNPEFFHYWGKGMDKMSPEYGVDDAPPGETSDAPEDDGGRHGYTS